MFLSSDFPVSSTPVYITAFSREYDALNGQVMTIICFLSRSKHCSIVTYVTKPVIPSFEYQMASNLDDSMTQAGFFFFSFFSSDAKETGR
jgi:hypothetical protein